MTHPKDPHPLIKPESRNNKKGLEGTHLQRFVTSLLISSCFGLVGALLFLTDSEHPTSLSIQDGIAQMTGVFVQHFVGWMILFYFISYVQPFIKAAFARKHNQ